MKNITWRPYQIEAKKRIKDSYSKGITEQLIVQATGTGKRIASINLIQHFKTTLFIAHREELIMQAFNEIERFYPMQTGVVKGKRNEYDRKIVVGSVQTLINRLDKIPENAFDLIIIDECHHYVSPSFLKVIRHFKHKLRTGWTATPKRLDGISLTNLFREITFEYRIENGIQDGWLSPIEAYQIYTDTDLSKVKSTAGDFNQKQLSEVVDNPKRNMNIVSKYIQYAKNRQAIAFCVDIDHAYNLKSFFTDQGINCEAVVSDQSRCPNRSEIIEKFQNGEIQVLTNVNILTEGFDYHDVGAILMARPTESETLYVQSIGRGTRLKSENYINTHNDNKCIVLDFVDNSGKHSLVNSWTLEEDKSIEDKIFIPEKHRKKLIEEREKRERKIALQKGKDKKIDLLKLPEVKVWDSPAMEDSATEKQLDWIKRIGLWQPDVEYTKAMASELISFQKCNGGQLLFLAMHGYDISRGATYGQFQKIKQSVERKNKFKMQ